MAKFRKLRSTIEGRQAAYERFVEMMRNAQQMTDEEICRVISNIVHFSITKSEKDTREKLLISLAVSGAKLIVDA